MTPAQVAALALSATVTNAGATATVTYTEAWVALPGQVTTLHQDNDGIIELTWQTPIASLGRKSVFNYNDPCFQRFT
jgi:hypothetical protein